MSTKIERFKDFRNSMPSEQEIADRKAAGWRMIAIEWERAPEDAPSKWTEEVPFGLRVSSDGIHLEENPGETEVLLATLEFIVQERRLTETAAELNRRGLTMRNGLPWGPAEVFNLLPRLIELGPKILRKDEWVKRRGALLAAL